MSEKKQKDTRTRNWTIVLYPESAPDNWRDIIDEWHIEWVESPLHDKDLNPTGEPKKAHYHVLLMFGSVKSYDQVLDLIQPLNCPIPNKVHNSKSLVRYMAHLDHPDKAQYDVKSITAHGGVDVFDLLKPSSSERYTYIREMQRWCNDNNVTEFQDLFNHAAAEHFDDWFPLLCDSCCYVMTQFLKSKRHSPRFRVDEETGEILD
jgi:hypothetical protein